MNLAEYGAEGQVADRANVISAEVRSFFETYPDCETAIANAFANDTAYLGVDRDTIAERLADLYDLLLTSIRKDAGQVTDYCPLSDAFATEVVVAWLRCNGGIAKPVRDMYIQVRTRYLRCSNDRDCPEVYERRWGYPCKGTEALDRGVFPWLLHILESAE